MDIKFDLPEPCPEEHYWMNADPDEMWVMDKLILSRKLNYICGPVGQRVPKPDWYIVRPCVNAVGLGMGAKKVWIENTTDNMPVGHFWSEFFEGDHLSVDYVYGKQTLCVRGFKEENTMTRWDRWIKTDKTIPFPSILKQFSNKKIINCEFIGGKLIEVHFRRNVDFDNGIKEFIPVWEGQNKVPPMGYKFIDSKEELNGRIGAFVK